MDMGWIWDGFGHRFGMDLGRWTDWGSIRVDFSRIRGRFGIGSARAASISEIKMRPCSHPLFYSSDPAQIINYLIIY